ncbi:helix-turn-helix transcriptional regulator [Bacillus sp. JCM 19041]|uniref:helix-turn-helix transcriptional regulator n=1 Tax=Bacillus sp. JCM 19041 TaxID=1460637 RepID=UPI0006D24DE1
MKNNIKQYRTEKGLSQGQLADLCDVSRQTINAIENEKYDPSLQLAFDLAFHLQTSMEEVFKPQRKAKS